MPWAGCVGNLFCHQRALCCQHWGPCPPRPWWLWAAGRPRPQEHGPHPPGRAWETRGLPSPFLVALASLRANRARPWAEVWASIPSSCPGPTHLPKYIVSALECIYILEISLPQKLSFQHVVSGGLRERQPFRIHMVPLGDQAPWQKEGVQEKSQGSLLSALPRPCSPAHWVSPAWAKKVRAACPFLGRSGRFLGLRRAEQLALWGHRPAQHTPEKGQSERVLGWEFEWGQERTILQLLQSGNVGTGLVGSGRGGRRLRFLFVFF